MYRPLSIALTCLVATTVLAPAHSRSDTRTALAPVVAMDAITKARAIIRDNYVLPDVAAQLDAALLAAQMDGRFADLSGDALAAAMTETLKVVTPDAHLFVVHDPARAAMIAAKPKAAEASDGVATPEEAMMIELNNGGVRKLEHLPGNIRYMDYSGFMWGASAAETALQNAMEFLRGGSAIIIDLRRNGGGSPDAVARLASYFVPAGTPLMNFEMRGEEPSNTISAAVPFTLADRPVFVLTSRRSASAAEEFAAHVAAFGFGKLVGETTAGAGFRNDTFALPGDLVLSVSTGQALQAKTGKGWERVGIAPAIDVPANDALVVAQARAIAALAATAPQDRREALEKMLPFYEGKATKVATAMPLSDYAGTYGPISVSLCGDGRLISVTPGGSSPLTAIGGNAFVPDEAPGMRVEFIIEGGKVAALESSTPQGPQRFAREQDTD